MINLIVATSKDLVIGTGIKIPWSCPEDMRFFKEKTLNSTIIMGRKTYESIGKSLPKRNNVVISSKEIQGVEVFTNLQLALNKYNDCWIIGGGQIYREALSNNLCDNIYLNKINVYIGKVNEEIIFMPWIDPAHYEIKSINEHESNKFTTYFYSKIS